MFSINIKLPDCPTKPVNLTKHSIRTIVVPSRCRTAAQMVVKITPCSPTNAPGTKPASKEPSDLNVLFICAKFPDPAARGWESVHDDGVWL